MKLEDIKSMTANKGTVLKLSSFRTPVKVSEPKSSLRHASKLISARAAADSILAQRIGLCK